MQVLRVTNGEKHGLLDSVKGIMDFQTAIHSEESGDRTGSE